MVSRRSLDRIVDWFVAGLPPWAGTAVVALVFLFAVRLLGTATSALTPVLGQFLGRVLVSDLPALGLGWLVAAGLGNGTVVAAVSLSLHAAGLVSLPQLFLLVVGSRLGATGIVLFIGALDHVRGPTATVGESLELGLLAAGLTASVYLPTAAVGYLVTRSPAAVDALARTALDGGTTVGDEFAAPTVFEPVAVSVTELIGAPVAVLAAVMLVFVALDLFDRVLDAADTERVRRLITAWLDGRWRAAAVGVVVTGLTTSVAFSLGVVVPLYNRGYVDRRETVPYVLGANVGTLADTLVVAALLGDGGGVTAVLSVGAIALVVSLVALVAFDSYLRLVSGVLDRVLASRRLTAAALAGFVATPLGLVLFG
ncbi:sodium:phosphate symporter [Salinigranum sp. GCM10025319]|uniref:sodium:phosphate symporter n=1 Tax=Salinigranum sp. GCM10025319 TaxID=3252687 RepID=UPI0036120779